MGLSAPVGLHDIRDIDAYVGGVITRSPLLAGVTRCEREELEAEGYRLALELGRDWNGRGTFRGYLSSLLALRLSTELHRIRGGQRTHRDGWNHPVVVSYEQEYALA